MSILTPDQRLRVFVSSTLEELADERRAAREAIESLRLTPVMFEQGARPHPPRALYRAYLEQSDVFVGLYWQRYGWVAPGEEVSGLEDEYRLWGERPKLIYIKAPAAHRDQRLEALIDSIRADDRVSYRRFEDAAELRSLIADDLAVLLTERFSASADGSRTSARAPYQLPHPVTRLIGREQDIARVEDLLADPDTRLVTIVGPGGVGKSRLALAVAERVKDRYPGGVAYVELAPVSEPALLLPTIARALGIEERHGATIATQLRDRLADERMLIVLDNMEQLTASAEQLSGLLHGTTAVRLLVTSRRVLEIRGERVFELEPLPIGGPDGPSGGAISLFIDRARAIRPGFDPTGDDLKAFAELARRLDGLPLAIELASARLRVLTPSALLERVTEERLDLGRGPQDLPARQRTLRDTIAWSHSLLSPGSKILFARFSVFVGSADLDAIDQVANSDGSFVVLDLIADLVDLSLVHTADDATQPRFAMLETIHEFAAGQLAASDEQAEVLSRHGAYYLALGERGNTALGTASQVEWLDRLWREIDNLRAVLRRAIRRDDATAALRIGRALRNFWMMRGSYLEARDWMDQIAAMPGAQPHERAAAATIGMIQSFWLGDFGSLESGVDDALSAADPDDRRLASFTRVLRAVASGVGHEQWQAEVSQAALGLETEGEPLAAGLGLSAASLVARVHGRLEEAQRLAQDALDLSRQIGESYVRAAASTSLARIALESGDPIAARGHALDGLQAAHRLRNLNMASYALELWATAELREGRTDQAGQLFVLAERGSHLAGSQPWTTDAKSHADLQAELQAAFGDRYGQLMADARSVDMDDTIARLIRASRQDDTARVKA